MFDILFDLDGTLVDSAGQCEAVIAAMRADRGHDPALPRALCEALVGRPAPELVPPLLGPAAREVEDDVIEFRARYTALETPVSALYPGVAKGLGQLAAVPELRLSICTAKPQHLAERLLEDTGIGRHFVAVVGGDRAPACKPHRAHADATLAATGGDAARAILVGDSASDRDLARNAGIDFLFVTWGYGGGLDRLGLEAVDSFEAAVAWLHDRLGTAIT
ncbi:HAD family hydrolase [Sphingomicrobium aestuariivivum]|uniref:HAD family hydrolase n=1 Tax=Sphingomicrobium aestuariivivum TaxID=1582356 RepID=UPI001FD71B68|nr:HAD hydrolase-like protein [Sphingomicrobium aestuariivivum]MCJ8191588.1 HAD hydrolase-like protein [Sphingomicrobium aestuariivivum]